MGRFLKKCKWDILLFFLTTAAWTGINVTQAFLLGFISETALNVISGRIGLIICWSLGYLILEATLEFAFSYSQLNVQSKISAFFRSALVKRIWRCSVEEKEEKGDGDYLAMVNDQVNEVESDYISGILEVICQLFFFVFALAATTSIQPLMALIMIALCILPLVIPKLYSKRLETEKRNAVTVKSRYINFLNELLAGFACLKIFGRSKDVCSYHDEMNEDTRKHVLRSKACQRAAMSVSYGLGNLVVMGAWVVGVIFAVAGWITVPEMIALTSLMNFVAGPFQIISEYYPAIISGRAIAKDLLGFLDGKSDLPDSFKSDAAAVSSLTLRHGTVIRGGRAILDDVSVRMEMGKKVCIIGASGSGKSTLLRTMAGILKMQGGSLCVNETAVENRPGLTHRELLYLPQNTVLFSASLSDNVSLFRKMPAETITRSLSKAGLSAWFSNFGLNMNKRMEKNSVNLSGGEQRRLDFARILAQDGKILLFDEPTAGLDAANARNIMEQIAAMDNRMVLVATHELDAENMKRFDEVHIMEQGKIIFSGTPDMVLSCGAYRNLVSGKSNLG